MNKQGVIFSDTHFQYKHYIIMIAILLFLKFQLLEAHKDGGTFQDLVHTVGLERLGISGSEISKLTAELVGCLHTP